MFSLLDESQRFLSLARSNSILTLPNIELLQRVIQEHNYRYYIDSDPVISDQEWDVLFAYLLRSEEQAGQVFENSPTNRFANALSRQFSKGIHDEPMISLANTYNAEDLLDFNTRINNELGAWDILSGYSVEVKLDGLWLSLLYVDGILKRALTRWNGREGEDVTVNILGLPSIPMAIAYKERIEIRGEIVLPRSQFERVNRERALAWDKLFANPRNAASGTLRQLDPQVAKDRWLLFYAYTSETSKIDIAGSTTYRELVWLFTSWGFLVSPFFETYSDINLFVSQIDDLVRLKEAFDFEIDGLVLKVDNLSFWKQLWHTAHHPRYAIAYKFPTTEARTRVLAIEHSVGRSGIVTPVALLEPIDLGWVTISRATLHNYDEVMLKDVRIGDMVFVKRAGEVIPDIVSSIVSERIGDEIVIYPPVNCPSCNHSLVRDEGRVAVYCPNRHFCPAQRLGALETYASKHGANIEGLGTRILEIFLSLGYLTDVVSIYHLDMHRVELEWLDGFGVKSISNLLWEIEKARSLSLERWLIALNIPLVGRSSARSLARFMSEMLHRDQVHLLVFLRWLADGMYSEDLLSVNDCWPQTIASLVSFVGEEFDLISRLLQEVTLDIPEVLPISENQLLLGGKSYCVTWSFESYSRDEIHDLILKHGGQVRTSVSKELDYLIAWEKSGSKSQKAEELNITIITLEEFLRSVEI